MQKMTFTLAEAAILLSCHKETLRRAVLDGSLQAAKLGREYRISRSDLETFWIALGGGELFAQEGNPSVHFSGKLPQRKKIKKPTGPEQLTLPLTYKKNSDTSE